MKPIPDYLEADLKILFVGYNPSERSGETGHHYANPSNRFWTILHRSGLSETKLHPEQDKSLLKLGYGFTNIVPRPTKTAAEILPEEYAEGRDQLKVKIERYRPRIVCFVGKGVYEQYSGRRQIVWGVQAESVMPSVTEFVGPSSSGLVRMSIEEVIQIYSELKRCLDRVVEPKQGREA